MKETAYIHPGDTPIYDGTLRKGSLDPLFQLTPRPKAPKNYAVTQKPPFLVSDQKIQICHPNTQYFEIVDQKMANFFKKYFFFFLFTNFHQSL